MKEHPHVMNGALAEALGLKNCVRFTLHATASEYPVVEAECIVMDGPIQKLVRVVKELSVQSETVSERVIGVESGSEPSDGQT